MELFSKANLISYFSELTIGELDMTLSNMKIFVLN